VSEPPLRIAVIGGGRASAEDVEAARGLGIALAEAGAVLVCGGLGGVMEGAARGAEEAGGLTVGILPGVDADGANASIRIPIPTGLGEARNALVVRAADAVVAIGGEWGTLSEIALARKMGVEVITLGAPPAEGLGLPSAETPAEAAAWALECARRGRKSHA
jgi:uncharacterized protein (TIGR00725 family)